MLVAQRKEAEAAALAAAHDARREKAQAAARLAQVRRHARDAALHAARMRRRDAWDVGRKNKTTFSALVRTTNYEAAATIERAPTAIAAGYC